MTPGTRLLIVDRVVDEPVDAMSALSHTAAKWTGRLILHIIAVSIVDTLADIERDHLHSAGLPL